MAVGRRLNSYSGMRFDIPHLRSLESATSYDFDSLLRGMFTGLNQPYLIRGFKLVIPQTTTESQNLTIEVADSAVLHSSASESGTILLTPPGIPNEQLSSGVNQKVIGSFLPGAINYVSLDYRRAVDPNTIDQTAGWSPSQQLEFQKSVPIGRILEYRFVISTSGFSTNLPLYVISVDANNNFLWATKAVPSLFRLGSGGANPNPQHVFNWGNYSNSQSANPRREWVNQDSTLNSNPLTVGASAPPNAFDYGDFSITNFKEWMDAVMTRFKEITGSEYWYVDSRMTEMTPSSFTTWWDSVGSVMTGAGEISYNLVLESSLPVDGKFQQQALDSTIKTGDIYVQGVSSTTKAVLTSYNNTQLMINSMTSAAFTYGEALQTRRIYRPLLSQWQIDSFDFGGFKYARLGRKEVSSVGITNTISSWSFVSKSADDINLYSLVTVVLDSNHSFKIGDTVYLEGLTISANEAPNGVFKIIAIPATNQIEFATGLYLNPIATTGVAPSNGVKPDVLIKNPYAPYYQMMTDADEKYQTIGGTQVKIGLQEHNFSAPQSLATDMQLGSKTLTVSALDASLIKIGMQVFHASIPSGAVVISKPTPTTVLISEEATADETAAPVTYKELVLVSGVTATGYADSQLNGTFTVEALTASGIVIDLGTSGPAAADVNVSSGIVEPLVYQSVMSVSGANQTDYNVVNVKGNVVGGEDFVYVIGPDTLPPLDPATGSISLDGVIATSTVLNPVLVSSIDYDHSTKTITVVTATPHGLSASSNVVFTIYGNQTITPYARTYRGVNIGYIDSLTYTLTEGDVDTAFSSSGTYVNPGSDKIFSKFADNPYAGPVAWSSDMVIKGIIGEIGFTIPKTAIIETSDPEKDSVIANNFNTNGVTGTAYLQDGEVLYAKLERNKIASNGAIFVTNGANAAVSTPSWITDENGVELEVGDWIKWQDEDEGKWLKIKTVNATGFTLETDSNQEPDIVQRPAKSGVIVYCKGSYTKLFVRKHANVDLSSDVYWLAVRRDNNGGKSKVYFRSLEVEAGEVRQISDNQNTNLLTYVGATNEGSTSPNYTASGDGDFAFVKSLQVEALDALTRMVTFVSGPERGFQNNDVILNPLTSQYYTVVNVISSRTVILKEDVSDLAPGTTVQYQRVNQFISDQDNLTLALRKEDRYAGHVETVLKRPIYDETIYIQKMNVSGTGAVRSGSYIYTGSLSSPTALAWVMHGTENVEETIESTTVVMPGGHPAFGANSILVHVYFGSFSHGSGINQNGSPTGRAINNPGDAAFQAPSLPGGEVGGIEIVLPPNRRTQVLGSGYVVWGTHAYYKQSDDPIYAGEELLVIVNDGIRHASIDYKETFGGPKGKIQIIRTTPPNTRMRFRTQTAYGSAVVAKSADASLQSAYNVGATILAAPNRPVQITSSDSPNGEVAQILRGSLAINGGVSKAGGIFNEGTADQGFVIGREDNKPKEVWAGVDVVKTHASHPDSAWKRATAAQTVTGDSATVVAGSSVQLTEGQAYRIKMNAIARRSDGPIGVSSLVLEGTFYMLGGSVYAAGSPISTINGYSGDGYNYAAAFGIQGTTVVLVVYGTSGSTIQWAVGMDWQAVGLS